MLVEGWNKLWSLLGPSVGAISTIAAIIGVVVLVGAIIAWLWQRRKGGVTIGGFPWMAVVIGAVLAGPNVVLPVLLSVGDAIIGVVSLGIKWVSGQF